MRVVVVYESSYGNTHQIASAIADGMGSTHEVTVVRVGQATRELIGQADLVVVGGPTHIHGMTRPSTRKAAVDAARKPDSPLALDPDAEGPGLREWFDSIGDVKVKAAAFDTRLEGPAAFTGRASKGIARMLRHHGADLMADPESFLVTKETHLEPGEEERARQWGETLVTKALAEVGSA